MANDETGTYQQAKHIFSSMNLHDVATINIDKCYVSIFRKHLVEMQKRNQSAQRFATRKLNNNQLKITRIE